MRFLIFKLTFLLLMLLPLVGEAQIAPIKKKTAAKSIVSKSAKTEKNKKTTTGLSKRKSKKTSSKLDYSVYSKRLVNAAKAGDVEAQCSLGFFYWNGDGVAEDDEKAFYWWNLAAQKGDDDAMTGLGMYYVKNNVDALALEWLNRASSLGNNAADYYLYLYYDFNDQKTTAYDYLCKAASGGIPPAQYLLGKSFEDANNMIAAIEWYKKAADNEEARGQYALGECYRQGNGGLPKDEEKAFQYYILSANQGYLPAYYRSAYALFYGYGVEQNREAAMEGMEIAADYGNDDAMDFMNMHQKRIDKHSSFKESNYTPICSEQTSYHDGGFSIYKISSDNNYIVFHCKFNPNTDDGRYAYTNIDSDAFIQDQYGHRSRLETAIGIQIDPGKSYIKSSQNELQFELVFRSQNIVGSRVSFTEIEVDTMDVGWEIRNIVLPQKNSTAENSRLQSDYDNGATIGFGGGAAVGAALGELFGGKGAAIGAAVGAVTGGTTGTLIGRKMDRQARELAQINGAYVDTLTDQNGMTAIKVTFDQGILFATGKSILSANAKNALDQFAVSLINNPQTNVQIYGHTDNTGSLATCQRLSKERARSVLDYLANAGVARSRMVCDGFDYQFPIASNETAAGRAQNRRVEIYITANEQMIRDANRGF